MCRLLSKKVSGWHAVVNNVIEAVQVARRGWSHAPHIFMVCHGTDLCTVVFTCFVRNIWYLNIWSRGLFIGRLTFCGKISVCCGWNLWKRAKPFNLYPCWCYSHVHAIIVGAYYETCFGFRLSLISKYCSCGISSLSCNMQVCAGEVQPSNDPPYYHLMALCLEQSRRPMTAKVWWVYLTKVWWCQYCWLVAQSIDARCLGSRSLPTQPSVSYAFDDDSWKLSRVKPKTHPVWCSTCALLFPSSGYSRF